MNYKLLSDLKNAGFPMIEASREETFTHSSEWICPNYTELLIACKEYLESIHYNGTSWIIKSKTGIQTDSFYLEEALACLWLELNK